MTATPALDQRTPAPWATPTAPAECRLAPLRPVHALDLYRLVLDEHGPDEEPHRTFARTRRQVMTRTMGRDAARCPAYVVLADGVVVGLVTFSDVVHGDACRGSVSVAVDFARRGSGLGSQALDQACRIAAGLGLRRLEAAVLPDDVAGRRLLGRTGFLPVGLARCYRMVDGRWRDHVLFERLLSAPEVSHDRTA
jgi:RimJ/RimL family protein N-acetyltransferase